MLNLNQYGAKIPDYWNTDKVVEAFKTLEGNKLREYFGCSTRSQFSRNMRSIFPDKPEGMEYKDYVLEMVEVAKPVWCPFENKKKQDAIAEAKRMGYI